MLRLMLEIAQIEKVETTALTQHWGLRLGPPWARVDPLAFFVGGALAGEPLISCRTSVFLLHEFAQLVVGYLGYIVD